MVFNGIGTLQGLRAGSVLLRHMRTCAATDMGLACCAHPQRTTQNGFTRARARARWIQHIGSSRLRANLSAGVAKLGAPGSDLINAGMDFARLARYLHGRGKGHGFYFSVVFPLTFNAGNEKAPQLYLLVGHEAVFSRARFVLQLTHYEQ